MNKRKKYMANIYSKYWQDARYTKYGFQQYDQILCDLLLENEYQSYFEVGIGNGYPIADFISNKGKAVSGIDISPTLIEKCNNDFPNIRATVGDAELINETNESFDVTYCFHSSWYFDNLTHCIEEMYRVTKKGGNVLLDLQNSIHPSTSVSIGKKLRIFAKQFITGLKQLLDKNTKFRDAFITYEKPTDIKYLNQYLSKQGYSAIFLGLKDLSDPTKEVIDPDDQNELKNYIRIILTIMK
ncbi:MAG: class I SAM-dependent methyltransferase [Candidatus Heimdallarchaeota archaeon]|nr:class I SAM-dependent methyltransferase [Candidatus Heimdallarchaeota archaeon]MDH5646657.1 class I SAM-dependent methyltransferase [Candidatus Heimdallarchaeota archaeon]